MASPSMPGWDAGNYPAFAQPWIGYFFWRLQSGDSPVAAEANFWKNYKRQRPTTAQADASLAIAQQLLAAAEKAREVPADENFNAIGLGLFPAVGPGQVIGVRVFALVRLTTGDIKEVSVLVDATANTSVAEIAEAVKDWLDTNPPFPHHEAYGIEEVQEIEVAEIAGQSWGNASITLG